MKWRLLAFTSILFVTGCSHQQTAEEAAKDYARAQEIRNQHDEQEASRLQAKNENILAQVPLWALKPPAPDASGVFAVGMGESNDLRIAQRKSMLEAEFGLAKQFDQEVSGSERSYTQEQGKKNSLEQYTALIDKLVMQVPVVGFEVISQEVRSIGGSFHSFVLLKLPYAEFNRVLQQQKQASSDPQISKAFDELEKRVKARQAQRKLDVGSTKPDDTNAERVARD